LVELNGPIELLSDKMFNSSTDVVERERERKKKSTYTDESLLESIGLD